QTIILEDTLAPSVTTAQGSDATNQCGTTLVFSAPVFSDCSLFNVLSNFVASGTSCRQTNTATWTATDVCGNATNRSQTIILEDTLAPSVTTAQGSDATNQCGTTLVFSAPVFSDCSLFNVLSNFVASGTSCRQTNTATWTATDVCGNATNRGQTIILEDTLAPSVTTARSEERREGKGRRPGCRPPGLSECRLFNVATDF